MKIAMLISGAKDFRIALMDARDAARIRAIVEGFLSTESPDVLRLPVG